MLVNIGYAWCKREQLTPINIEHSPPPPPVQLAPNPYNDSKTFLASPCCPFKSHKQTTMTRHHIQFPPTPRNQGFPCQRDGGGGGGGGGARGDPPLTIYLLISPVYSPTNFLSPHPKLIFPTTPLNKNLHAIT